MVLLKEISEGIWGLTVGPNKETEVATEHPFRLTMAALEIDDGEDSESPKTGLIRVTLKSVTADKGPATDLILCNLQYPSCLQQPLDIEFYEGQTLTFGVKGPYKVHLTGYVLQSEPHEMSDEDHSRTAKSLGFIDAGDDMSSDDDSEDDDDDDDDDDEDDDDGEEGSDEETDFHVAHRHRLRDDEDQDLEGDYEDGYLEGEDDVSSDGSSSESDDEEVQQKASTSTKKGKKRPHPEENGHSKKQEPNAKKLKKNKNEKEQSESPAKAAVADEPKKNKKDKKAAATTSTNEISSSSTTAEEKKKPNALEINDGRVGNGPEAKLGKTVAVYYTGRLKSNNKVFDSCTSGKPFRFRLGAGEVIRGWDQGVKGMRVGGKRRLVIPPGLAYGSQKLPDIPPNSTLIFDIELKNVF